MNAFLQLPLAVDASTIGTIIALVISFIVWVVNQASSKAKQEEQKRRQAQAAQRQRQRPPLAPQQQQPRASQEDEVDAFLRSAAQQRQQPQQTQRTAQQPPQRQQRPPQAAPQQSRPAQRSTRPPAPPSVPTSSAAPEPPLAAMPLASEYAGLQTSDFGSSAERMGHFEGHDHDLERHVSQAFDHDISSLDDRLAARDLDTFGDRSLLDTDLHPRADANATQATTGASDVRNSIVEMFRNPANFRNALIMQEIMRRPVE